MITSVINQKGGTGKTTTTVNLASALAEKKSVLIIDLDPQGNLSYSLGINEFELSIADVLAGRNELSDVLVEREGMKVAPTNRQLSRFESGNENTPSVYALREALKGAEKYDHVFIDCPPSLSALTANALSASNNVVIPIQLDVFSIQGLEQIMDTINEIRSTSNKKLQIAGVLPVLVDARKKLTMEVKEYVRENFDVTLFKNEIRTNVKAAEAPSFGSSVIKYAPSSNSAKDYKKFSQEFLKTTKKLK